MSFKDIKEAIENNKPYRATHFLVCGSDGARIEKLHEEIEFGPWDQPFFIDKENPDNPDYNRMIPVLRPYFIHDNLEEAEIALDKWNKGIPCNEWFES